MDKRAGEDLVLARALEALRGHGLRARIVVRGAKVGPTRPDAVVEIGRGAHAKQYAAEVKRNVQAATIGVVRHLATKRKEPTLLVADYVTPALADKLKENNLTFADTAGNAYIDAPGLLIWVKGNRPQFPKAIAELRKQYTARALEPAGLKVLFAFLCDPTLVDRPFREIATTADVAHGTVGEVMAELPHRGYVYDFGIATGGRRLQNVGDLLDKWAEAYARKLKPKLFLGRYRAPNPGWWQQLDATKYAMVLGAEPAAARLTQHLKPAIITLYGERAEPRLLVDHALRTDPRGDVEIAHRFWRIRTDEAKEGLAPLPLIYADLLATADPRCIETAGLIRERYLDRLERKT
jgi:hypothetical protein